MSEEKRQIPVLEGFFTWPSDEPRLIGGKCKGCGEYFFPKFVSMHNPDCEFREVEEVLLSRKGRLWTYTIIYYKPPLPFRAPEPFKPFGIGIVELPEGIRVIGQMTGCELNKLKVGMEVEMVVEKQHEDNQGNEYMTWKFRPF